MTLLIQGQKGRKYRRITITLDQRIENKIKELQIKKENQIQRPVSFSKILNKVLMDALKNGEFVEGEFLEKNLDFNDILLIGKNFTNWYGIKL